MLGEALPVNGTPFTLNYRSDRVPGRRANRTVEIQLSGATVPSSLRRIELEVRVAGQLHTQTFTAAPDQVHVFTWDGKDAYGRTVQGEQVAAIRIGYVYGAVYYSDKPAAARSFGRFRGAVVATNFDEPEFVVWQEHRATVGVWDARAAGLGAWTLDVHHSYDPVGEVLYLGDGQRRSARLSLKQAATAIGFPRAPDGVAATPDGSVFFSSPFENRVMRRDPDGTVTTVAGSGIPGCNGPALSTQHRLNQPSGLAPGPGGTIDVTVFDDFGPVIRRVERAILYIADTNCHQVHELRPAGGFLFVHTLIGDGVPGFDRGIPGFGGDDVQVSAARLNTPRGLAAGPDGSLYIADTGNHRIRRIAPGSGDFLGNGVITTIAGNGVAGFAGDGALATNAQLNGPTGISVGPDGSVYIADTGNHRIRRVRPDGVIVTIAGTGVPGFSGDDGPATDAQLRSPRGIFAGRDGFLFIADSGNNRLRTVTFGTIVTVAGAGTSLADGVPPSQARLLNPGALAAAPDRSLYVADTNQGRVVRLASALPAFTGTDMAIASEDALELYRFDESGRHVATLHAMTGGTLYTFGYDGAGQLASVTDGHGNTTAIERDGAGAPTAIVSPFGPRTALTVDGAGYLATLMNPASETRRFTYHGDGGLLATHTHPRGGVHRFTYDDDGRLVRDEDPAGGFTALARTETASGFQVTRTTAESRVTTYAVEALTDGGQRRTATLPSGLRIEREVGTDGSQRVVFPDGTAILIEQGPDPRFGMQAPVPRFSRVVTPGGLVRETTVTRAVGANDPSDPLAISSITETTTVNGRPSSASFDTASRTLSLTSAAGRSRTLVLDAQGRVIAVQAPDLAAHEETYDARGRLITTTRGGSGDMRRATLAYDTNGYLAGFTDAVLDAATLERDAAGRVVRAVLANGWQATTSFDADGNVASLAPPARPAHVFGYTADALLAAYTPPDVGGPRVVLSSYDRDRQLDLTTRADGGTVDYAYDTAGRLSAITIARGRGSRTYDATSGQPATTTAAGGGTLTHTWDGTLPTGTTWSGAVAGAVTRTYDNDFRVASSSVNGADTVFFQYDADGLLAIAGSLFVSRHPQNDLVTGTSLGAVTDAWTHNAFGEPVSYVASIGGTAAYASTFVRDKLGRVTQHTETIEGVTRTIAYAYDALARLTQVSHDGVVVRTYTYDLNGNRLAVEGPAGTVTGIYDAQDRLVQYGAATYAYTADGELQSKSTSAQTVTYRYDELGNLIEVVPVTGARIDYVIDGMNRRVGKRVNGALVQGFLYDDQLRVVAELNASNTVVSRFVWGLGVNTPDYMIRGGATYRIVTDHLGSPRMVVDVGSGAIVQRMDYDEFGVVVADTNPGFQPFGFAGGLYDRDTRLTRFGERDYDAEAGRWTTKDPLRFEDGLNLYAYVGNDPANATDPTGTNEPPADRLGLPGESSKEWAKEALKEMKQSELRKAEAARKAAEAAKKATLLDKVKNLFKGRTGCGLDFLFDPRMFCGARGAGFLEESGICPRDPWGPRA